MNTNTNLPVVQVEIMNGKPSVTSLQIAEAFGKEHKHVLRDIEAVLPQVSEIFGKTNFGLSEYTTINNLGFAIHKPMYLLTKDGFSMLAMGYTGPKAFALKEHILAKLNAYESGQLSSALPNFADPVVAARAWADALEQKRETEQQLALAAPKAEVYDNVVADKNMTIARFARTLRGVNTNSTKGDLYDLDYLYKMGGVYRVYAKFRDTYFTEKVNGYNGRVDILVLDKGKQELVKLYHDGKLTMKKGEKPCARRS